MLIVVPTFAMYEIYARMTGARVISIPAGNNCAVPEHAVMAAITARTRLIAIANPNNPTGTLIAADEMDSFVDRLPAHVLLVLDEAYGDFAEHLANQRKIVYSHALEYVTQGRNVILLKTFSKAHGLAGLRVGYGIGTEKLISLFTPLRTIFSVSSFGQAAAAAALHDSDHIQKAVENNAEQAEVVTARLGKLGFNVPQTWANFVYCELCQDAASFSDRLRERGFVVQPLGLWGAPTAIRVSIGTPKQNDKFLAAMKTLRL